MPAERECVVVTGAGSGIGAAIADRLLAKGHDVRRLDITGDNPFDVTSEAAWESLPGGDCTGLVHAAGIRIRSPLPATSAEDFARVLDVNVVGTFLALRWTARRARSGAAPKSVVLLSSATARRTVEHQIAYNASKAAIESLTRSAALELAGDGVRVNAIAPGSILTPMTSAGWADRQHAERMEKEIPVGRPGTSDEIANIAEFLLSAESGYVTGAVWTADGGWST